MTDSIFFPFNFLSGRKLFSGRNYAGVAHLIRAPKLQPSIRLKISLIQVGDLRLFIIAETLVVIFDSVDMFVKFRAVKNIFVNVVTLNGFSFNPKPMFILCR